MVRPIQWTQMPRVPHGLIGTVACRYGLRKVAAIICENDNPRKPKGSPLLAKPYTLELYLPLLAGQDRILKFVHMVEAEREANKALLRFIADMLMEE